MDDARSELRPSRFAKACKLFETIIDDRREPGAVRVQAANGLLRAAAMEAELPKHIITGSDKVSISASVEEVEGRGDEQIAQDYRELLG
jgi:methylaspartate ammonia-lyase